MLSPRQILHKYLISFQLIKKLITTTFLFVNIQAELGVNTRSYMKTYLVTGGCGFIGSHLVDALLAAGHHVIVIDNLSSGKHENISSQVELIVDDIRNQALITQLMARVDGCFHLAAIVSPELSNLHWVETNQVNLAGTITVFNAAKQGNRRIPVVYTSSSAVYGDNPHIPLVEAATPHPLTAYGLDKLCCEYHARIGWEIHGIPTVGLRLFNVYGSRQDISSPYSGVISLFFDKISKNQNITIYGDGEQTRDFIYVADVVRFFIASMQQLQQGHAVYNICSGTSISINQLKDLIGETLGKSVKTHYQERRAGDIYHSIGNGNKAKHELGLEAKYSLPKGLQELTSYFNQFSNFSSGS